MWRPSWGYVLSGVIVSSQASVNLVIMTYNYYMANLIYDEDGTHAHCTKSAKWLRLNILLHEQMLHEYCETVTYQTDRQLLQQ